MYKQLHKAISPPHIFNNLPPHTHFSTHTLHAKQQGLMDTLAPRTLLFPGGGDDISSQRTTRLEVAKPYNHRADDASSRSIPCTLATKVDTAFGQERRRPTYWLLLFVDLKDVN